MQLIMDEVDESQQTARAECLWEWNKKCVSPTYTYIMFPIIFGPVLGLPRFDIGQRKTGLLVVLAYIVAIALVNLVHPAFGLAVFVLYFYELLTAKKRYVIYNKNLRQTLKDKWKVDVPLSSEQRQIFGLGFR